MNAVFVVLIFLAAVVGIGLWFAALGWLFKEVRH